LKVVGSSDGRDYQQHATWYFHEIQQHSTQLELLFEEEIAQSELISLFEQLAGSRSLPVKVLVHYEA
jgi:alcohol dehydrogenase